MTSRRLFLQTAAGLASLAQPRRPNVVFILCDDLGYADLGCYGNRTIQTPNLDRLASEGVRFTDFHVTSPVCSPTRTAFLTGQYQQRYGIHHADVPERLPRYFVPESAVTIAEVLQAAGYYTAHVGKWHISEPPGGPHPLRQGFDHFFGSFGGRPSSSWIKYARSMDPEMILGEERPRVYKGHVTDVQTDAALEVIERQARAGRPFFLNVWYNAPHEPLAELPHQAKLYGDWEKGEQTYFQTVTDLDAGVGRILRRLDELAPGTLVLFSSDNGPEAHRFLYSRGSAWPLKGMKTQLWEGGIRVPCLARWPGRLPPGAVSNAAASALDFFPTIAAAAQAPVPSSVELDGGVDLVGALTRGDSLARRSLFFEFRAAQRGVASSLPLAVRQGEWKLFADFDFRRLELYNLASDIGETQNVAAANPQTVASLLAELRRWKQRFPGGPEDTAQRVETPSWEELDKRYYRN